MRKLVCAFFVLVVAGNVLAANRLIVTSDGKSFWAMNVNREGDIIKYTEPTTGEQKSIPVASLHGVIPSVARGQQYTPGEIQKYIDRIKGLQAKHKGLQRQLKTVLEEWELLQKPNPELEASIDKLKDSFFAGGKTTASFKQTTLDLGMIRYKDPAGKYTVKLDDSIADVTTEYVKANKSRLEALAASAATMKFEGFVKYSTLTEDVLKEADDASKAALEELLVATRQKVFDAEGKTAYKAFVASKSIDAYLEAVRILRGVRSHVAETEDQKTKNEKNIAALLGMAKKANPSYTFNEAGYPMTSETSKLAGNMHYRSSVYKFEGEELDEEVFMMPTSSPGTVGIGRSFSVPFQLVLMSGQPADRNFAIVVTYAGFEPITHVVGKLAFKNGLGKVTFSEDFSKLGDGELLTNSEGKYTFYFHLAYEMPQEGAESEWQKISKSCVWPIRP